VVFPYAVAARDFGYLPTHAFAVSLTLTFLARDLLIAAGTLTWLHAVYSGGDRAAGDPDQMSAEMDRRPAFTARG
jgi:hypothetical protein